MTALGASSRELGRALRRPEGNISTDREDDWRELAACIGHGGIHDHSPDWRETNAERNARLAWAKAVCSGCEVRSECYATCLRVKGDGVWAGVLFNQGKPVSR